MTPIIRQPNQQDNRWRSSLRRHDPELQPSLPSINNSCSVNTVAYSTESKKVRSSVMKSAMRKSRSVERMRALRKFSSSKLPKENPKKSSSEEGNSDDQENSMEENLNTTFSASPKQLRTSSTKKINGNGKQKVFVGYESSLIEVIEKDILQKYTKIQWNDIAGLSDAKNILQECLVLPIIMPDFFKGIRRPWKGTLLCQN